MNKPSSKSKRTRSRKTLTPNLPKIGPSMLDRQPGMRQSYEAFLRWVSAEDMAALCAEVAQDMGFGEAMPTSSEQQRLLVEHAYLLHKRKAKHRLTQHQNDATSRRRARKNNSPTEMFKRSDIIDRDHSTCYLCGHPVDTHDIHLDHVIPISKGGPHTADNVRVTHSQCNLRKGASMPSDTTCKILTT